MQRLSIQYWILHSNDPTSNRKILIFYHWTFELIQNLRIVSSHPFQIRWVIQSNNFGSSRNLLESCHVQPVRFCVFTRMAQNSKLAILSWNYDQLLIKCINNTLILLKLESIMKFIVWIIIESSSQGYSPQTIWHNLSAEILVKLVLREFS